jgi:hypothetical protein
MTPQILPSISLPTTQTRFASYQTTILTVRSLIYYMRENDRWLWIFVHCTGQLSRPRHLSERQPYLLHPRAACQLHCIRVLLPTLGSASSSAMHAFNFLALEAQATYEPRLSGYASLFTSPTWLDDFARAMLTVCSRHS